ncbi:Zinc finger, RING-CH-type [Corchorus olitorius]|uniref:Zinc finger, RING-CH-type n=1 Tax=Corchorus olitorius TaxID=93759 RepID=A0A1R3HSU9_9ROSI|nr:Zinc finger, RING-CH-type [Corchorus olitorius]
MGDHFVLLVDRLLTESTLEAAIESRNQSQQGMSSASKDDMIDFSSYTMDEIVSSSPRKLVECRICHDEDEDLNMEYAHRKCVQRWCNEKGDISCEICHQQYKPNYTAPPPLFHYGGVPMNFRGNWEISRRDLPAPRFITMVTTDRDFLESDFDDYSAPIYGTSSFAPHSSNYNQWSWRLFFDIVHSTNVENHWDSVAYIYYGQGIHRYPASPTPPGWELTILYYK